MRICQLDAAGLWTGEAIAFSEFDAIPRGWVVAEPPANLPEGGSARYSVVGGWAPVDAATAQLMRDAVSTQSSPLVPNAVSMRQARLALLGAGLLAQVEVAIEALPEPDKSAATIEWEYATELRRDHPLIATLTAELELTLHQVDELFIAAAAIE